MLEKYTLLNEPDKTMFVFTKNGKYYGHIIKNSTAKAPAKLVFETAKYETVDALKADYPPQAAAE
ncbi:hypothetical protein ACFQI7_27655 [Paenibacillus allorhizosphaerae]|uniref:Phage protein n=1 Tax=Paenibacillus allorhizosphaerae TaxID=2849866 RepID=A0ABN7TWY3_9BACL|nr:hypothetical protein [Paenibacillus allorhizosphaerae]CAG7658883.1 hypothetical protein PAECIP111802_07201 [Paenibacillus allorhizosphaerae]